MPPQLAEKLSVGLKLTPPLTGRAELAPVQVTPWSKESWLLEKIECDRKPLCTDDSSPDGICNLVSLSSTAPTGARSDRVARVASKASIPPLRTSEPTMRSRPSGVCG